MSILRRKNLNQHLASTALLLAIPWSLAAQSLIEQDPVPARKLGKAIEVPAAPDDFIMDDGRIFSDDDHARISEKLRLAATKNGISVYIAAYSYVSGESIESRLLRLRESWLESDRSVVMIYERGSKSLAFGAKESIYESLPKPALSRIFQDASFVATEQQTPAERIEKSVDAMIAGLIGEFVPRDEKKRLFDKDTRSFLFIMLGGILFLGALALGFAAHNRREEQLAPRQYRFPRVDVGQRFGAPYGGGVSATLQVAPQR